MYMKKGMRAEARTPLDSNGEGFLGADRNLATRGSSRQRADSLPDFETEGSARSLTLGSSHCNVARANTFDIGSEIITELAFVKLDVYTVDNDSFFTSICFLCI